MYFKISPISLSLKCSAKNIKFPTTHSDNLTSSQSSKFSYYSYSWCSKCPPCSQTHVRKRPV